MPGKGSEWNRFAGQWLVVVVTEAVGSASSQSCPKNRMGTLRAPAPPSYRGYQMYNSTQQATWSTTFNLARLYYGSLKLTMDSFSAGFRFEVLYWIEKYAFCLNFVQFSTPITIKILIDNRLE